MEADEYKCDMCNNIYRKGWSDEEAKQECIELWGIEDFDKIEMEILCDDCFQKVKSANFN